MRSYVMTRVPVKRRAKAALQAGRVVMYSPAENRTDEKAVAAAYTGEFYECPVKVEVHVYRALPKSRPKKVTSEPDVSRPDVDNVLKSVMDGLIGVAYPDDALVVDARVIKHERTLRDFNSIRFYVEPVK